MALDRGLSDTPQSAQRIGMRRAGMLHALAAMMLMVIFAAVAQVASAATFHAIIVGDTNDRSIGKSVTADIRMAKNFAEGVAAHYGNKHIIALTGTKATPTQVTQALRSLNLQSDDFMFFYYSGHGDTSQTGSPWPRLIFGGSELDARNAILRSITNKVSERHLVLFDACNGSQEMPPRRQPASSGFQAHQVERLFKSVTGSIIATSSQAPYVSYADSDTSGKSAGSRYSVELFSVLGDALTSPGNTSSWSELLGQAAQRTQAAGRNKQVPKYAVTSGL